MMGLSTVRFPLRFNVVVIALLAAASAWVASAGYQHGRDAEAHIPDGYVSEIVVDSIPRPMDLAFAPDGRIFIATLNGDVLIVKDGALLAQPFTSVPANWVYERGLVGLALDPDFAINGYVYLYYTLENSPLDPAGPKTARLVRMTADGDVALAGSETILMGSEGGSPSQPSCEDFPAGTDCIPADSLSHTGGALRFAPDGKLFLATGDAQWSTPNGADLIARPQNLDSLAGKLLRINPDGSAPSDNPFYTGDPSANRSKVWAYGLRQPFRMGIEPATGLPFVGEVGSILWEEINLAEGGLNFGWPCYEGFTKNPALSAITFCEDFYATQEVPAEPLYSYSHFPNAAVIGGAFAQNTTYSPEFQSVYFFGDWVRKAIYTLSVDGNGELLPESGELFMSNASNPTAFARGLDGEVYYLAWPRVTGTGELRHIAFTDANQSPVAQVSASPLGGLAPLAVQFSSNGSFDPEGEALSFTWEFEDGPSSVEANPSHTFVTAGNYNVTLTVTDDMGNNDTAELQIVAGNEPPKATITMPPHRAVYEAWDVVAYAGYGVDPEEGDIGIADMRWTIVLRHCEPVSGNCHTHPFIEAFGSSGTLLAPDQGDTLNFVELSLTVIDAAGLSATDSVAIGPDTDGDGLLDFEEVLSVGTNYLDPDTDGDGTLDGQEDSDGDGCMNVRELGVDAAQGGGRDPANAYDFYDVLGPGAALPVDGIIDLPNDILGVIQHFSPQGQAPYDVNFDRGPQTGANVWNMSAPDGVIDLPNDILGVIQQFGHRCV